jgi:hypothetical protein
MTTSRPVRFGCSAVFVAVLAALAALVTPASAGSASNGVPVGALVPSSEVAGVQTTRLYIDRFRAVGKKVVGRGTAVASFKNANGHVTVRRTHYSVTLRTWHRMQLQQQGTMCSILYLELGELDLTLAGLHAVLHAADPTQPVQLRLQADDQGGILGRLFCQLAQANGTLGSATQAKLAARQLNKHLRAVSILRAKAVIYVPNGSRGMSGMQARSPAGMVRMADECAVLHLILGPLHLDLLGLVVDLNKIVLDLTAVPGTLLGNIFCQLVTPPPPPAAPVASS